MEKREKHKVNKWSARLHSAESDRDAGKLFEKRKERNGAV